MKPFDELTRLGQLRRIRQLAETALDAYGLKGANLTFQQYSANIVYRVDVPGAIRREGEAYPIDFEDCGFGYWLWDLAIALWLWTWTDGWHWRRDALLEGYAQVRTLPQSQIEHLDLFMAAQYATMVLWASLFIMNDPARRAEHEAWREGTGPSRCATWSGADNPCHR
jgi:Ser/Thr protein kinase RdoA (MazF antagonist)